MRIFLVHKHSFYSTFFKNKKGPPLSKSLIINHRTHLDSVRRVQQILRRLNCHFKIVLRTSKFTFRPDDLIITIGGDGTFLRTAHHVTTQMILGVNSDPQHSVGALCSTSSTTFEKKIRRILSGQVSIQKVTRIKIVINDRPLELEPINDVLFTNESPAATSRYMITLRGKREEQKSSGVWISGPCGFTAGILAAGGKKQGHDQNRLQFLVREPFQGTANPYKLKRGFIRRTEKITLVNQMPKACLFLDGPSRIVKLTYGDKVMITVSRRKLKRII